jgi:hypothetical protein
MTPTVSFPTTLPNVKMSSYSFAPVNSNIRTEMDSGMAKVRRRFLAAPTDFNVTWELSMAELGIFEKFYQNDVLSGSVWFNISLVNGVGQTVYAARFKEPYKVSTTNREYLWAVTATLETLSRPLPL